MDANAKKGPSLVTHKGGCHCGAVRFECDAEADGVTVLECNCSICKMKQNHHFMVPGSHFRLLQGEDKLTSYQFNTGQAQHLFCSVCGVQSFYSPRSHPGCRAVTIHCVDPGTINSVTTKKVDGVNWENTFSKQRQNEGDVAKG